jgi:hypothetical protein
MTVPLQILAGYSSDGKIPFSGHPEMIYFFLTPGMT